MKENMIMQKQLYHTVLNCNVFDLEWSKVHICAFLSTIIHWIKSVIRLEIWDQMRDFLTFIIKIFKTKGESEKCVQPSQGLGMRS